MRALQSGHTGFIEAVSQSLSVVCLDTEKEILRIQSGSQGKKLSSGGLPDVDDAMARASIPCKRLQLEQQDKKANTLIDELQTKERVEGLLLAEKTKLAKDEGGIHGRIKKQARVLITTMAISTRKWLTDCDHGIKCGLLAADEL